MGVHRLTSWSFVIAIAWLVGCGESSVVEPVEPVARLAELRPTEPGTDRPRFEPGDVVEQLDSPAGSVRIHFTRRGENAVPAADADRDGTPDYVQTVAREYDEVAKFYVELGYREPLRDDTLTGDHGGDGRFDVYLLDFPTSADGSFESDACLPAPARGCIGFMVLENDFAGRRYASTDVAIRLVASHEFFHAVQNAYESGSSTVLAEGTAVWASEAFDSTLTDFENQLPGYLDRTERSLGQEVGGPVDPFTYGSAVFFEYLSERYGREVIRELWQALTDDADASTAWPETLDRVLTDQHDSSLADAFARFAEWNLYTGSRADPDQAYAQGTGYPQVGERTVDAPFNAPAVRVFPLSARYYALSVSDDLKLVAAVDPSEGETTGLGAVLARESDGKLGDLQRLAANAGQLSLQAQAGDTVHLVVFNTEISGDSVRPNVCFGAAADVTKCRGKAGESAADAGAEPAVAHADAGGCTVTTPRGARGSGGLFGLFLLLGVAARRRRRLPLTDA